MPPLLRSHPVHLIVLTPQTLGPDPEPPLRWMQRHHPAVGLLVYSVPPGGGRDAWHMGRLGVDELVVAGVDHGRRELRRAARRALARALGRGVATAVQGRVDPLLERSLRRAVAGATVPMTPDNLAAPEGVDAASLARRLRALGLPPIGRILRWGILLRAAAALDRDESTIETIALELGYSTGTALARALRREFGHPPTTLRQRGALRWAIETIIGGVQGTGPGLVRR